MLWQQQIEKAIRQSLALRDIFGSRDLKLDESPETKISAN